MPTFHPLIRAMLDRFAIAHRTKGPRTRTLVLEPLEDRTVPTIANLAAVADGYANDLNIDGTFETLNTTQTTVRMRLEPPSPTHAVSEDRGLFEFNLGTLLPASFINSASLKFTVASYSGTGVANVDIFGYTGNGSLSLADATASATLLGSASVGGLSTFTIPLDVNYVRSIFGTGGYLGLQGRMTTYHNITAYSNEQVGVPHPTLVIDYTSMPLLVSLNPTTISEAGGSASGTVTRTGGNLSQAMIVNLASNDTTEATVPSSIVIQAGQASASFTVTAVDDALSDGTQVVSIAALASNYGYGIVTTPLNVTDYEPLMLTVSLAGFRENAGPAASIGTVTRTAGDLNSDLVVNLSSNDTTEVAVPATVTILGGQTQATFPIDAVDDTLLDGFQFPIVTASAPGFNSPTKTIQVSDHETITLNIVADTIGESGATPLILTRSNTDTAQALTVTITEVTNGFDVEAPFTLQIPAGQQSLTYSLRAFNDLLVDGDKTALISANATGYFGSSSDSVTVTDDDLAPLSPGNILVSFAYSPDDSRIYQFNNQGQLLQGFLIPHTTDDDVRDLVVDLAGQVQIFNGTFDPQLTTLTPATNTTANHTFEGWSTVANLTYGGIAAYRNYIFVTDMTTFGDEPRGIIRFDTTDYSAVRFSGNALADYTDLTMGLDGWLYAPATSNSIDVYDPVTLVRVRTVTLDQSADYRGSAVDAAGNIYMVTWNGVISKFTGQGAFVTSLIPTGNLSDIDVHPDGRIITVDVDGYVTLTDTSLASITRRWRASSLNTFQFFVAFTDSYFHNRAPVAAADAVATDEDIAVTTGVIGNDSDPDGDAISISAVGAASHGTTSLNANGTITYTPNPNYNGPDAFTYTLRDALGLTSVGTVNVTVNSVNDAPSASNDNYATGEDTPLNVAAPGVLANDSDPDGNPLSAVLVVGPAHGALTLYADGSFSYTPHANYNGSDSFTYKANDGAVDGNTATVTITIQAVNDAPIAGDNAYTTNEDTALIVAAPGVLSNDTDVEGSSLSAAVVTGPAHGILTLNADGSFTYTPAANYNGSDSFTYRANDGQANSNEATVILTIAAVNDAPVADAGPDQSANEGATVSFNGSGTFDVDGDLLTYAWTFGDGAIGSGAAPTHVYADNGSYIVTLMVNDGQGGSSYDTLVVTVNNVAPTATVSGPATGVRGQARTFTFGAIDPSPIDQEASFTFVIAWGDGSIQTVTGPDGTQVDHVYAAAGTFNVSVTAKDKDNETSAAVQRSILIKTVDLQGTVLAIGGTTGGDNIVVKRNDAQGNLKVTIGGVNQGTFAPTMSQIVVFGQAGNDDILLDSIKIQGTTYYVTVNAILFGDAGADALDARGSIANNVLSGGSGNDTLQGGAGRDILLGGIGADVLRGNNGEDVLVGNTTDFDANLAALNALMAEWGRTDANYTTRANHLRGLTTGGNNGAIVLNSSTIDDDAAIDQLYGGSGSDLFFYKASGSNKDKVNDLSGSEIAVVL